MQENSRCYEGERSSSLNFIDRNLLPMEDSVISKGPILFDREELDASETRYREEDRYKSKYHE